MTQTAAQPINLNDARSSATRQRLIESAIAALIEVGFSKTTGVEVCRRAGLTRGALNHHFPDFVDLLTASLGSLYEGLLETRIETDAGPLEQITLEGYSRVSQPQFKAVIELWLASRNDAEFGQRLSLAIQSSAQLFAPEMVLAQVNSKDRTKAFDAAYRTIFEALIGIGLGRAVGNGQPMAHEPMVLEMLTKLAREHDDQLKQHAQKNPQQPTES